MTEERLRLLERMQGICDPLVRKELVQEVRRLQQQLSPSLDLAAISDYQKPRVIPLTSEEAELAALEKRLAEIETDHDNLFERIQKLEATEVNLDNFDRVIRAMGTAVTDCEKRLARLEAWLPEEKEPIPQERMACFLRNLTGCALPNAIFNEWKALMELIEE